MNTLLIKLSNIVTRFHIGLSIRAVYFYTIDKSKKEKGKTQNNPQDIVHEENRKSLLTGLLS